MMGGLDITTAEQARTYTAMLKEPVEIGQHVEEPACLPEHHPQWQAAVQAGRECPRVDLHRDDSLSFDLLLIAAGEHTRQAFVPKFEAAAGHWPADEREALIDRVVAGLTSPPVVRRIFPKVEGKSGS